MIDPKNTRHVVSSFLQIVRSGRSPERSGEFLAPLVLAHQVQSEAPGTVERTPEDYAEHVRDMLATWGDFELNVEEFLVDGNKAHVRFCQIGRHVTTIEGIAPTQNPVRQLNSVVYQVDNGLITQYWMHIDRAGVSAQLHAGNT